jgi:hypothetical protein
MSHDGYDLAAQIVFLDRDTLPTRTICVSSPTYTNVDDFGALLVV